jgi:hypothetical protein
MHPSTLRRRRRRAGERHGARGRSERGGREQRAVGGVGTETSERGGGFVLLLGGKEGAAPGQEDGVDRTARKAGVPHD